MSLELLINAGYDPTESPKLFKHLKHDLKEEKRKEPFFFGSHPRLSERIENYETLLKTEYKGKTDGIKKEQIFLEKIKAVVILNAFLDLKAGRFKAAERGAEKYSKIVPHDPRGCYLMGEICRQKGEEGDKEKALAYYLLPFKVFKAKNVTRGMQ